MKLEIVDPLDFAEWDQLVLSQNNCSFFHSSYWLRVLSESYRYNPIAFLLTDGCRLIAIIPVMEIDSRLTGKRGVCLPFSDYSPPLFNDTGYARLIIKSVLQYGKKEGWNYFEMRGGSDLHPFDTSAKFYHHLLSLNGSEDEIFSGFKDNNKRNIRKSIRDGIKVRFSTSLEALKQFYVLHCKTRKRHGLPPQPSYFFEIYKSMYFEMRWDI